MGTKINLLAGVGTLYTAAQGEALPEVDNLAPPAITVTPGGNWTAIGYTIEDHDFDYEVEHELVQVNESNGAVKAILVKEGALVKFKFAERDLAALNLAMPAGTLTTIAAGADQTAQDNLGIGDGTLVEKSLLYLGRSPEGGSRLIHIPIAVASGGVMLGQRKGHKPYDVEYTVLSDMTQGAGYRLMTIYDITAAASS